MSPGDSQALTICSCTNRNGITEAQIEDPVPVVAVLWVVARVSIIMGTTTKGVRRRESLHDPSLHV